MLDLSSKTSVESKEISPGIVLDYDSSGDLVGIDIDNASKNNHSSGRQDAPPLI